MPYYLKDMYRLHEKPCQRPKTIKPHASFIIHFSVQPWNLNAYVKKEKWLTCSLYKQFLSMATQKCPRKERCKIYKYLSQQRSCLFQSMFEPLCNANGKMLLIIIDQFFFIFKVSFRKNVKLHEKLKIIWWLIIAIYIIPSAWNIHFYRIVHCHP